MGRVSESGRGAFSPSTGVPFRFIARPELDQFQNSYRLLASVKVPHEARARLFHFLFHPFHTPHFLFAA